MREKTLLALVASLLLLIASGPAAAGERSLASPAIYGGGDADLAYCVVRNAGTKPAAAELRILDESGTALETVSRLCNGAPQTPGESCLIQPGSMLSIRADAPTGFAYACSATGKVKNLRGALYLGCCRMSAPSTSYRSAPLR